jgi:hypothetical protein
MRDPGLYRDVPEDDYHSDHFSLSVSGAKLLLQAPALYQWRLEHPEVRDYFDFGAAAHSYILGTGRQVVPVDALDWRTIAVREERDRIRGEGKIPVLMSDWERIDAMADAITHHRMASNLLSDGDPEVSAYALDPETGILRRGRIDYLNPEVVVDYKTTVHAEPGAFATSCARYGYDMQAAWYLDLCQALGEERGGFAFIAQEKEPPYLVEVYTLDDLAEERGRRRNRRALEVFRRCLEEDDWPGYTGLDFTEIGLPRWALMEEGLA